MSDFQAAFARALFDPDAHAAGPLRDVVSQPAFAVYRNTVMKACIDALEANFPAVARLAGREWFRAAAAQYASRHPPTEGSLLAYGDGGFGAFLQQGPGAAELTYLPGVAHLDALWRAVHVAADAPVLAQAALAGDAPEALAVRVLRPHPATRWAWFDAEPVATIWSRNRSAEPDDAQLVWQGEGLLFVRHQGCVTWQPLSRAGCAFLDACAQGACLGAAAAHALDTDPQADLAMVLQQLLRAGAFCERGDEPDGDPT